MLDYSVSYYLGDFWSNTPLYAEKIVPALDYALSNNFVDSTKLSASFYDLINKYKCTDDLPLDSLREFLCENGYEYIVNLFVDSVENLKVLTYIVVLLHLLKGSKEGIEILLSLFQSENEPSETKITQWYNLLPVGEENTFYIETTADISKAGKNFFENFSKFIRHYVYPELTELRIRYSLKAEMTFLPYVTTKVKWATTAVMEQ